LPEAGYEETAERSDDIAGRSLSCTHYTNRVLGFLLVYPANGRSRAKNATTSG
jgi:hypothetical protein